MQFIGRQGEITELERLMASGQPEFVVVYGRRRVGKTCLIRHFFSDKFTFYATGVARGSKKEQLSEFYRSLREYGYTADGIGTDWFAAFEALWGLLERSHDRTKVIFLDELPWMDTQKAEFIKALELFWNKRASKCDNVKMIVCGSAASWMVRNILNSTGGLHNRVTCKLKLLPLNLGETRTFLVSKGIHWDDRTIAECYMVLGGIPYYLNLLDRKLSLAQNVDRLFFSESALLENEFSNLYASLFKKSEEYVRIIEALSRKKNGLTRDEISALSKISNGGGLTRKLQELEQCDFIRKYRTAGIVPFTYQLTDFFSIFHLQFVKDRQRYDSQTWMHLTGSRAHTTWTALAYERLCFANMDRIKQAIGISGIATRTFSFRTDVVQVDMVIERADRTVTVCEIKYSDDVYTISGAEAEKIVKRVNAIKALYKGRRSVFLALITSFGLKQNDFAVNHVNNILTLADLMG